MPDSVGDKITISEVIEMLHRELEPLKSIKRSYTVFYNGILLFSQVCERELKRMEASRDKKRNGNS
jgi:hypothetical protein